MATRGSTHVGYGLGNPWVLRSLMHTYNATYDTAYDACSAYAAYAAYDACPAYTAAYAAYDVCPAYTVCL